MATKSLGTTFTFTPAGGAAAKIGQLSAISELNCDSELIDAAAAALSRARAMRAKSA